MAEDAFGYEKEPAKILIVDDINDTGATFDWIMKDWAKTCLPGDDRWNNVFGNNVRFAVMTENLSSNFEHVAYNWDEVNKAEEDVWLVYPYE
jgi:hypoxanthine phosphoribosyltransferase